MIIALPSLLMWVVSLSFPYDSQNVFEALGRGLEGFAPSCCTAGFVAQQTLQNIIIMCGNLLDDRFSVI